MPELVLGPLLRYVDEHSATLWVETDAPCEVEILGRRQATFHVAGHHYALLAIEDLVPGDVIAYTVSLDGETVWPLAGEAPSTIATLDPSRPVRLAFGSCHVAAPHTEPWTRPRRKDARGRGPDALAALARALRGAPAAQRPSLLLMVGDQVYADDSAPETRAFIRARRSTDGDPGEQVADFEEYTRLYRETWGDRDVRWLLSTLPTAMIFDDHEVIDDWNSSASWRRDVEATGWWTDRIAGALTAYWLYQHLGNLSPAELADEPLYAAVRRAPDGGPLIREFALRADRDGSGTRWSYARRLGGAHLVVLDSRAGRVLEPGHREMIDVDQWAWLDGELRGDVDHLLVATSLPYLLPRTIHAAESWSEAVANGAWGAVAARGAERLRRMIDLEHWPAFRDSFETLARGLAAVSAGQRGRPPATIVLLSGDVHYGYLARASFPGRQGQSAVYQAVASPFRMGLSRAMEWANRIACSRLLGAVATPLLWTVGIRRPPIRWRLTTAPVFDSQVAMLDCDGRHARLSLRRVADGEAELSEAFNAPLA